MRKDLQIGKMVMAPMVGLKASVLVIASLLGFAGCSEELETPSEATPQEEQAVQIDPLLKGPMGLVWLESKESLIEKGIIGTIKELYERDNYEPDWETDPYSPDDPSCLIEEECYTFDETVIGDVFSIGSLGFENGILNRIILNYKVEWNEGEQTTDLESVGQLHQSLYSQLAEKYEIEYEYDWGVKFIDGPVEIQLTKMVFDEGDIESFWGHVTLDYEFDSNHYYSLLSQRDLDEKISQQDL